MLRSIISVICFLTVMFVFQALDTPGQEYTAGQLYPVTVQGSLRIDNVPANGLYDIQVYLHDAPAGGGDYGYRYFGETSVTNGIFTVTGPFGQIDPATGELWLEFRVKPSAANVPFVPLLPRQRVNYAPYAVNAVTAGNALNLGGISSSQFVKTDDARLSDARNPIPGSSNYIQNTPNSQTGSFNLNGTGTANIFNAATQFSIGGNRILSAGGADSIFAGFGAGQSNTTGASNSFFGVQAGGGNLTGNFNSFFGRFSGFSNNSGGANSFFGASSGQNNTSGGNNAFFGDSSGLSNITGSGNTVLGVGANVTLNNLTNATAIGFRAAVGQSNSLILGSINGINNSLVDTNVGIGTITPTFKLQVVDSSNKGLRVQTNVLGGTVASFGTSGAFQVDAPGTAGGRLNILENGNVGLGTGNPIYKLHVVGENIRIESPVPDVFPRFSINFSSGGINQKKWQNYANANSLNFTALNDAESAETFWMQVNRGAGTAITNVVFPSGNVGIGNSSPTEKLQVTGNTAVSGRFTVNGGINYFDTSGNANFFMKSAGAANGINFGVVGNVGSNSTLFISQYDGATYQDRFIIDLNGNAVFPNNSVFVPNGTVNVGNSSAGLSTRLNVDGYITLALPGGGTSTLCRNSSLQIAFCSSSIRYKQNIQNYGSGLDLIKKLRPVTFNWKVNNEADLGLIAEETAEVEPLLITRNDKGETEGVKYDRVGVVLVNAVNEQQTQIEEQQKQIDEQKTQIEVQQKQTDSQAELIRQQQEKLDKQQSEIEALKAIVCAGSPAAKICREEKP
jgi:hypothetical protein